MILKLIQDVIPVESISTDEVIHLLWKRGVGIERIFGQFYEMEEMASHQGREPMTVADAELAGVLEAQQPLDDRPF